MQAESKCIANLLDEKTKEELEAASNAKKAGGILQDYFKKHNNAQSCSPVGLVGCGLLELTCWCRVGCHLKYLCLNPDLIGPTCDSLRSCLAGC